MRMFALFEDARSAIGKPAGSLRSPAVMHIGPLRGPATCNFYLTQYIFYMLKYYFTTISSQKIHPPKVLGLAFTRM